MVGEVEVDPEEWADPDDVLISGQFGGVEVWEYPPVSSCQALRAVWLPLQLWITRNDTNQGRSNDIRKIFCAPTPRGYHSVSLTVSRQHFLFIIKHDLRLTTFHIERIAGNIWVWGLVLHSLPQSVTVLAKAGCRLTVWLEVQFKIRVFALIGCKPTVKTLILTVSLDRSAVSSHQLRLAGT